jgi:hypothetical protein
MILIIFGTYALITAKLQISRHYGLKGKGARIAGVVHSIHANGTTFERPVRGVAPR